MSLPAVRDLSARPRILRSEHKPVPSTLADSKVMKRRLGLIAPALFLIVLVFSGRCAQIAWNDSITSDETTHLIHSLHYWQTGDDLKMWELGTPRFPHLLNAWPTFKALRLSGMLPEGVRDPRASEIIEGYVLSRSHKVLVPARSVAICWGVLLLITVYWSVSSSSGPLSGLIAAGLVSLVPEVVAHSSIAGSDISFTMLAFLAVVLLARYASRPTRTRWLHAAGAIGMAWATRHSALLLLGLAGGIIFLQAWRKCRGVDLGTRIERLFGALISSVGMALVSFVILWAGDGFAAMSLGKMATHVTRIQIPSHLGPIDISSLLVPTSFVSVLKQISHQAQGHEAYFLGQVGRRGWPLYFPVALLLKTPIGLLALLLIAAVRVRPQRTLEWVCLAALAMLWLTLIKNHVNIGLRYALLTYPLAVPFAAGLFTRRLMSDRVWRSMTILALGAFLWSSWSAQPRCLSYFNEIGGGPRLGWLYLADSNIDWGQDFDRLTDTLRRLKIEEATIDVSTERRLVEPWIFATPFPAKEFQVPAAAPPNRRIHGEDGSYLPVYTRYLAVSVSRLMGLYSQNDVNWLRTRRIVARVGDSIFLLDLDSPADPKSGPFLEAVEGLADGVLKQKH